MGDRTIQYYDCPECKGKNSVEEYDAPSSMMFVAVCELCGWKDPLDYYEVDENTIELITKEKAIEKGYYCKCGNYLYPDERERKTCDECFNKKSNTRKSTKSKVKK